MVPREGRGWTLRVSAVCPGAVACASVGLKTYSCEKRGSQRSPSGSVPAAGWGYISGQSAAWLGVPYPESWLRPPSLARLGGREVRATRVRAPATDSHADSPPASLLTASAPCPSRALHISLPCMEGATQRKRADRALSHDCIAWRTAGRAVRRTATRSSLASCGGCSVRQARHLGRYPSEESEFVTHSLSSSHSPSTSASTCQAPSPMGGRSLPVV